MKWLSVLVFTIITQVSFAQQVKLLDTYIKIGFGLSDTRFVAVLEDNSIYWYAPKKDWQKLSLKGLPSGDIQALSTYVKRGGVRILVMIDNKLYWFADKKDWKPVDMSTLPSGYKIKELSSYVKYQNNQTRIIVVLDDGVMYWFDEKKWNTVPSAGLPKN